MEEALAEYMGQLAWPLLAAVIVAALLALARGADWLVEEAVGLSERSGVPKVVIGATIVSIGTTTPEAVVSVLAAVQGKAGLALGNAVGSIICDTGLILGLACLIAPLPLDRSVVHRQGRVQLAAAVLLVAACVPWLGDASQVFRSGGRLPQAAGFLFLILLLGYLWVSVHWARLHESERTIDLERVEMKRPPADVSARALLLKLLAAIALVVAASAVLIPAVSEAAARMNVPDSIIAATMVAFGTSLPELITAITAARAGHGELAVGNVIGADILNVLFVAGASAAATRPGLTAPDHFFYLYFPSMLLILAVFRVGVRVSKTHLKRPFGIILLATYLMVTALSYIVH